MRPGEIRGDQGSSGELRRAQGSSGELELEIEGRCVSRLRRELAASGRGGIEGGEPDALDVLRGERAQRRRVLRVAIEVVRRTPKEAEASQGHLHLRVAVEVVGALRDLVPVDGALLP